MGIAVEQLDLFATPPRARRLDPMPSHVAAKKAEAFAGSHAERILAALRQHGPRCASTGRAPRTSSST